MKIIDIELDDHSFITKPSIHDGFLEAISLEEEGLCRLKFKRISGEKIDFIFQKVLHLRARDFLQGNIVGDLLLFSGSHIPIDRLQQLMQNEPLGSTHLLNLKEKCLIENLQLFEIEPSYGCRLQVLCKSVMCVSDTL